MQEAVGTRRGRLSKFSRPLHTNSGRLVIASITQTCKLKLKVDVGQEALSSADEADLKVQVRCCRLLMGHPLSAFRVSDPMIGKSMPSRQKNSRIPTLQHSE